MDAAAVFYLDQALPTYYEIGAQVAVIKPTGGWNANAFLIFDYFGPTDFKFAGLDQSTNKVVLGHRTATEWVYDIQANMLIKAGRYYEVLVVVNGLVVTVLVDGVARASYTYAPREVDGEWYGLEMGLVGVGSNNSRGSFDNFSVAVLPPQATFEEAGDFADGVADRFTGSTGDWAVTDGRYAGTAAVDSPATSIITLDAQPEPDAYVELEARVGVAADGVAGFVFDHYSPEDFKFLVLDAAAGAVVIGHMLDGAWFTDVTFTVNPAALAAGAYLLMAELSGASVNVYFAGALIGAFAYNGALLDGALGLLVRSGTATFDDARLFVGTHVINAVDNTPPVLTVPPDVTVTAAAGATSTFVSESTLGTATATDNTVLESLVVSGVPDGNLFPIGVTVLTWTATDVFGNETIGAQLVTVLEPLPAVNVKATDGVGAEQGPNSIVFTVTRSLALGAVTITLAWSGTAAFGTDYTVSASGGTVSSDGTTLTLADGVASATLTVVPVDDAAVESSETVVLALVAGSGYAVGSPSSASGTIADNDAWPVITITAADSAGGESGQDPITLEITRTGTLDTTITVALAWSGTAALGSDYTVMASGGTLSADGTQLILAAGVAGAVITVTPIDDTVAELAETIVLDVVAGTGYTVGSPSSASGSIADDDVSSVPVLSVTATDTTGAEPTDPIAFTITRTGDDAAPVTVSLAWSGGATYGVDYTVTATGGTLSVDGGTLTLAAGVTSVIITVTPLDDTIVEAVESVVLSLVAGTGYAVGSPSSASGTIADDDVPPALPVVTIQATDAVGAEPGADTITFTLTRTGDLSAPLVVGFGWFGTAKLGKDFTAAVVGAGSLGKTTVTFAAGMATLTIVITPIDDTTIEATETVIMTLKAGTVYTLGAPSSATASIQDNDGKTAASTGTMTTVSTGLDTALTSTDTALTSTDVTLTTSVTAPDTSTEFDETVLRTSSRRSTFDLIAV